MKIPSNISESELKDLVKESLEEIIAEKKLTQAEEKTKEKIVKGLKDKYTEFKQKYGNRAKEVMYAVATKMAQKEQSK